jgi:hypothetical protein
VFLKDSQNIFIKKLLIRNKLQGYENILPYVKEYVMKKRRVKYLAIREIFLKQYRDLFFLKDEVREFESYDIIVQRYSDLNIKLCGFIKELG